MTDFGFNECPKCGLDVTNCEYSISNAEQGVLWLNCTCADCGHEWVATYDFAGNQDFWDNYKRDKPVDVAYREYLQQL